MWEWSSWGESGAGFAKALEAATGGVNSLGGICSARPLGGKSIRRGVMGAERSLTSLSSFEVRRDASRICGEGDSLRAGVPPLSDSDRVLDLVNGDLANNSWSSPSLESSAMAHSSMPIGSTRWSIVTRVGAVSSRPLLSSPVDASQVIPSSPKFNKEEVCRNE